MPTLWELYHLEEGKSIAKRKTETSSEVKSRWINANYKRYGVSLRYDTDGDLIEFLESHRDDGKGTTEIFRKALKSYIKTEGS